MLNSTPPADPLHKFQQQPSTAAATQIPHEERLLDSALKHTFPASDPVAEWPLAPPLDEGERIRECLLDDAIELSFPASDPIAVSGFSRIEVMPDMVSAREDHQLQPATTEQPRQHRDRLYETVA